MFGTFSFKIHAYQLFENVLKTALTPGDMIWHLNFVSRPITWYLLKKNKKSTLSEKWPPIVKLYQTYQQ